ncbi:hypothetical protein GCM10023084_82920 [Streptomyces lacrimifluminis]|uniref:Uncharacterized protein n=1 Tax=Streptomyces lacrimifluminis TaxID=1500077 RepID=A0A917UPK7_9ACTN|nr:hypothetical protein [Streptomyces lacrimifluminis]GGJ72513.1 hypothetical protein GCM10012282_81670 [Streptomyces lacrimifluminis]
MTTRDDDRQVDVVTLVNEIQGHLLLAATRQEGHEAAARLTARLDWLTSHQRADLERQFAAEHLALARTSWQRTAARSAELRAEYEARYRRLKVRLTAACLALAATTVPLTLLLLAPLRR